MIECRRSICDNLVLPWLDGEYCSERCRMITQHPEFGVDGPPHEWWLAQKLACQRPAGGPCRVICGGEPDRREPPAAVGRGYSADQVIVDEIDRAELLRDAPTVDGLDELAAAVRTHAEKMNPGATITVEVGEGADGLANVSIEIDHGPGFLARRAVGVACWFRGYR